MRRERNVNLDHLNLGVGEPGACRDFYGRRFDLRAAFEAEGG